MSEALYVADLATGSTTLCRCWRLTTLEGAVLGFTDHDGPLTFDGTTFEASTALTPSEATASLGLSIDEQTASGAFSSEAITEAELRRGVYDGASVEVFDVNWTDTARRRLEGVYIMGTVQRGDQGFQVEMVSRSADLSKRSGNRFFVNCPVQAGGEKCGVNLDTPEFKGSGVITTVADLRLTASNLDGYEDGWFDRGKITWATGANAGRQSEVRAFTTGSITQVIGIWRRPFDPISVGDTFTITAGCDKSYATCRDKFGNGNRFRGFPHMPPESFPAQYAVPGDPTLNGASRFA